MIIWMALILTAMLARPRLRLRSKFREHGSIAHARNWRWYRAQNSIRGLSFVARVLKKPWIDQDIRRTKDGVLVCCHWVKQDRWFLDGEEIDTPIEHLSWEVVQQLVSIDGYRITSLQSHFAYVAKKRFHIGLKIEPKNPWTFTTIAQVEQVVGWSRRYGVRVSAYILPANNVHDQADLLDAGGVHCSVIGRKRRRK